MPAVININNSLLVIFDKYGLTNKGASTWPIIIFAVAPSPTGPPMLKIFSKINEIAFMILGNIFKYHNQAVSDEITIIRGSILNAKINSSPTPIDK